MHRETLTVVVAAGCLWLATTLGAEAQQSIRLRYQPGAGSVVHTLWRYEATSTVRDGGDALTIEAAGLRSLTHRVLEVTDGVRLVEVTRDSVRLRRRPRGGMWTQVPDVGLAPDIAVVAVDDRLRVQRLELRSAQSASASPAGTLRAFAAGLELAFPEEPQTPGATWTADLVVPLNEPIGLEQELGVATWVEQAVDIVARSTLTLDSIVVRGTDTLVYLEARGSLLPTTLASAPEAGVERARLSGALGGRLIWSTGWQTFVSGALRVQMRMATFAGLPQDEVAGRTLETDITTRFQVRR
ncbi:MAG: hypothetical protein OER90_02710 [Gemmatimonadota bacterium]|nr:hypothetical protein [Gemmatimonadota bacterium]